MYDSSYAWVLVLLMIGVYVGIAVLSIWITYLIIRTAVKNGILLADRERGRIR